MRRLQEADQDAVVLYLAPYADHTDADEIRDVVLVAEEWTCERHRSADGGISDVHHPVEGGFSVGWDQTNDEQWTERVVILSTGHGGPHG
jgi:hypothetical protein